MAISPRWTHGRSTMRPKPSTATLGQFMIGVAKTPPKWPKLVMVNELPFSSLRPMVRSRAFLPRSRISVASSRMLFLSTSLMTGTISPSGVSTAMPKW